MRQTRALWQTLTTDIYTVTTNTYTAVVLGPAAVAGRLHEGAVEVLSDHREYAGLG